MAQRKKVRQVARITVYGMGKMSKRERQEVVKWLQAYAQKFKTEGDSYSNTRFTARFGYISR